MNSIFDSVISSIGSISIFLVLIVALLIISSMIKIILDLITSERSYKVAIFGLPRSGKTTLISMLFYSMMTDSISRNVQVSGDGTIKRITSYIEAIKRGVNLGPTTDQDVYSFRFRFRPKTIFPALRRYDVEIADFPGEYSTKFSDSSIDNLSISKVQDQLDSISATMKGRADINYDELRGSLVDLVEKRRSARSRRSRLTGEENLSDLNNLYDAEFQSYLLSAHKYIIMLDINNIFQDIKNVPLIEGKVFSAIMSIRESSPKIGMSLDRKKVALVFSKCDLIANESRFLSIRAEGAADDQGNENFTLVNSDFDPKFFNEKRLEIYAMFRETLSVLEVNFLSFETFFHSSYMRSPEFIDEERRLLHFLLPK